MAARLGELERAREALERYLREEKVPAGLERARGALDDVLARWKGHVNVSCATAGAEVTLDQADALRLPLERPIDVTPGPHTVRVTAPGHPPLQRDLVVKAGETVQMVAELTVAPAPVPLAVPVRAGAERPLVDPAPPRAAVPSKGLSTLSWVLIGAGAAALVGGGVATYFLLRERGANGADLTWTVR